MEVVTPPLSEWDPLMIQDIMPHIVKYLVLGQNKGGNSFKISHRMVLGISQTSLSSIVILIIPHGNIPATVLEFDHDLSYYLFICVHVCLLAGYFYIISKSFERWEC